MKIAIVSSGLEHVKRGIETWARQLYEALKIRGIRVDLYKGTGEEVIEDCAREIPVPCINRGSAWNEHLHRMVPSPLWRVGLTHKYDIEQGSFAVAYWFKTLFQKYDIIHTQDPWLAKILDTLGKAGLERSRVILAHGTEEAPKVLKPYRYLQHLAPWHMEQAMEWKHPKARWSAIPNFVDVDIFKPGDKASLRKPLGFPPDAFIALCVASIKKTHKRIDYLIGEFSDFLKTSKGDDFLVIAGSSNPDTPELVRLGQELCGDRVRFLIDQPHERMADLYRMADVFVMGSLLEMMPVALLEAMASGLPAIVHEHPVMRWMVGDGGEVTNMSGRGGVAQKLSLYRCREYRENKSQAARERVVQVYSRDAVVDRILEMYDCVLHGGNPNVLKMP